MMRLPYFQSTGLISVALIVITGVSALLQHLFLQYRKDSIDNEVKNTADEMVTNAIDEGSII
jgi:hypothetical protein